MADDEPDDSVVVDLAECPRCGAPHNRMRFLPLKRPMISPDEPGRVLFRHWSRCYTTDEPVLLRQGAK